MKIWRWVWIFILIQGCASMPPQSAFVYQKMAVGNGPEDILLQRLPEGDRLLVSCNTRREDESPHGEIHTLDPVSGKSEIMPRENEPEGLVFNPHGIDLVCAEKGCLLYIVSHDDKADEHSVLTYLVEGNTLRFQNKYTDSLLVSPNAVAARADGSFFVTNDSKNRGSKMEGLLKIKGSTIISYDGKGKWTQAAEKLSYANGIALDGDVAYVATTRQNHIYKYDIVGNTFENREEIAKVVGGDNLRFDGEDLIVPAHLRLLAFVGHAKKIEKKSPTVVYRVNPKTKERTLLYCDDGNQISGGATGLIYKNHLYISQVFDPFILKVKLK